MNPGREPSKLPDGTRERPCRDCGYPKFARESIRKCWRRDQTQKCRRDDVQPSDGPYTICH